MRFHMTTQQGAESIMRNVAKRILYGEAAQALISWQCKWIEARNRAKGERIMQRVGVRWKNSIENREISEAFLGWHYSLMCDKNQSRAEAIMRRVGGRFRNKELAMHYAEWVRNAKAGVLDMWRQRTAKLEKRSKRAMCQMW